jgi:hypothetical protein
MERDRRTFTGAHLSILFVEPSIFANVVLGSWGRVDIGALPCLKQDTHEAASFDRI